MNDTVTLGHALAEQGVSRRRFLQYCAGLASLLGLSPSDATAMAQAMTQARRPSVIWLGLQGCTGCTESITRSHAPTLEHLILNAVSLDFHHTLQMVAGAAAERVLEEAATANAGKFILAVEGAVPLGNPGYMMTGGKEGRAVLASLADKAAAVVAVGSCASYGGLPAALPNPTGAVAVNRVVDPAKVVNLPGCPPIPVVITAVLAHYLTFGVLPRVNTQGRPRLFYGDSIHDRCPRRAFYERGLFAESFDDDGARKGWCLFKLGCRGPTTRNACATLKWNGGVSFPIQAGHPCLGCSEPGFWDTGGFYETIAEPTLPMGLTAGLGVLAGAAVGAGAALLNQHRQEEAASRLPPATVDDLEKPR